MLTTTMPLVSLALWSAVAESGPLGRFGRGELVAYFLSTHVVRQLTGSWLVWEMNQEIKSGTLARRLLKPIHPLIHYSAENLAALPLRAAISAPIAIVALVFGTASRFPRDPVIVTVWLVSLFGAWLINFFTMSIIGTLAFFIESSTAVFEVWLLGFMLLSGYLMPLELLPSWARVAADVLPFRYTLSFPVEIAIGLEDRASALRHLGIQWAFVVATGLGAVWLFQLGLKRFQAFGS
jgi:ABC-2 type transport system permease protein